MYIIPQKNYVYLMPLCTYVFNKQAGFFAQAKCLNTQNDRNTVTHSYTNHPQKKLCVPNAAMNLCGKIFAPLRASEGFNLPSRQTGNRLK